MKIVIQLYVIFFQVLTALCECPNINLTVSENTNIGLAAVSVFNKCNEDWFVNDYVNTNIYITEDARIELKESCGNQLFSCREGNVQSQNVFYRDKPTVLHVQWYDLMRANGNGCWGYLIEIKENNKVLFKYINFKRMKKHNILCTMVSRSTTSNQTYSVYPLPYGKLTTETIKAEPCINLITAAIVKRYSDELVKCKKRGAAMATFSVRGMAVKICNRFQHNDKRMATLKSINLEDCVFSLGKPNLVNKSLFETDAQKVVWVLALLILLLSCALLVAKIYKRRKTKEITELDQSSNNNNNTSAEKQGKVHSVMILNRPGCELLETFLRDLAFILSSYDIDVKLALLEKTQLDLDGGIACYLQRNIEKCDYILIICTEKNQDTAFMKHNAYECAIKIIAGLSFYNNDNSRYIPIYLKPYKEAISMLPIFLIASRHTGYQMPKEINKLLRFLIIKDNREGMEVKRKFFIRRMETLLERIQKSSHPECIKDCCSKGEIEHNVDDCFAVSSTISSVDWPDEGFTLSSTCVINCVSDAHTLSTAC